jgi:membrane protein
MGEATDTDDEQGPQGDITPSHGDPSGLADDQVEEPADHSRGRAERVTARYEETRRRLEHTTAAHVTRRAIEVDVVHQALVFAALGFLLMVPILISVSALIPLGVEGGVAAGFAARVGLTAEAARDLQQLFSAQATVRSTATWAGVLLSVVCAISWPLTLQKGYELAWGLPRAGLRELWRPVAWLAGVVTLLAIAALLGGVSAGAGRVAIVVLGVPALVVWSWWTQHFLLSARVGWRALLPGAIAIAVGLVALAILARLLLSTSIVTNHDEYGPIGVVFMVLSWLIALSVVLLGGALLGATLGERSRIHRASADPTNTPAPSAHAGT